MPSINIYKIKFDNDEKEYIGSTSMKLSIRKASFKQDMKKIYGDEDIDNMTEFYQNIKNGLNYTIILMNKLNYDDKIEIKAFIDNQIKLNNNLTLITSKTEKITDNKNYQSCKNEEYKNKRLKIKQDREEEILNKLNSVDRTILINMFIEELGRKKLFNIVNQHQILCY